MNVNLKLTHEPLRSRVDAPCKGVVAKALGKYQLEERLPGITVQFKSYQRAEGQPEEDLSDDAPVVRDSILNFTVKWQPLLQRLSEHDNLFKPLYKPVLETLTCKFAAALLGNTTDSVSGGSLENFFRNDEHKRCSLDAALTAAGSDQGAIKFANALDKVYASRNERQHLNTKAILRKELKELHDAGVAELMADVKPEASLLVSKFDLFLQLLPG